MAAEKIELHRTNFQYGTIGFEHFPDILEGRKRHSSIFRQPLESLPYLKFQSRLLERMRLVTLSDLLNASSDQIQRLSYPQRRSIQENLADFFEKYLILGPEDHLLRRVFGKVMPVTQELEDERNAAVAEAINGLDPFKKELLRVHFGLDDGLPKSLEAAGRQLGLITTKRPRLELYKLISTEQEALRNVHRSLEGLLPPSPFL